jgi:Bacterial lectin
MNYRWKPTMPQLAVFISLMGLLILLSGNAPQPAAAQATLPAMTLVGNAVLLTDRLRLTVDHPAHTGAAWLVEKQQVQDGFTATVDWQITKTAREGAEGFAFVIHNADVPFPASAIGTGRNGLGYAGLPNSLAVEFDTVQNLPGDFGMGTHGDPNDNHISVQSRGKEANNANTDFSLGFTTQTEPAIPLFTRGRHTAKIVYTPGNPDAPGHIAVYLDNMETPVLTANVNLAELLSLDKGSAWVGFTAATGRRAQFHDIYSFSFAPTKPSQQQRAGAPEESTN